MKTISKYSTGVLLILTGFLTQVLGQTTLSCCSNSSTSQFAMLGKDASFKASHFSPLPFHYDSPKGKMIEIKTGHGKSANAFEVKADKSTDNYLIVIHEWWGLNDYIKQEAEKLQNELMNVNVIALDLYDGNTASNPDDASKLMSEAKEERIRSIIGGAIDYAGSNAKIQTIGWCFGGGWSLQASIMAGKHGAGCIMYYGMPEKNMEKLKSLSAPVLGIFASKDAWITNEVVSGFVKNMKLSNKSLTVKTFEADHAFANPSNPNYDKKAAADAHILAVEFLKKHLDM